MRLLRTFVSLTWRFLVPVALFGHLWGVAQTIQLGPHYRTGFTLELDHEHDIAWGELHVVSVCTATICDVRAYLRAQPQRDSHMMAMRGGVLHFEVVGDTILTTPVRPQLTAPAPPPPLWIPGWITFLGVMSMGVQSMSILNRRDRLVLNARPCVIRDGHVEFIDGKAPRFATSVHAAEDGTRWACVRFQYGHESYREESGERCDVLPDRDGAIAETHRAMLFVVLGGVMLVVAWLPLLFVATASAP